MTEIIHTRRARNDLKRIWKYIALDSERAAEKLLRAIEEKIERLRQFPQSGALRDDIRPNARTLVHGRYIVFYVYDEIDDVVRIVTVMEGDRDLPNLV